MNHYFIGKYLKFNDQQTIRNIQRKYGTSTDYYAKFYYLGYMDDISFFILLDRINNIFEAIIKEFSAFNGYYIQYLLNNKILSLEIDNDTLKNIIIPYIHSYFEKNKQQINPYIDVAKINGKLDIKKIKMPEKKQFLIDSLDIIRGKPLKKRHGPSSINDDMTYDIVHKYIFYGDKK